MDTKSAPPAEIISSESVQRKAWRILSSSFKREDALSAEISVIGRNGTLFHAARHIPLPQFNKVYSLGVDGNLTDEDIDSAKRWLIERCSEPSYIMVPPIARVDDLDGRMACHGLKRFPLDFAVFHKAVDATTTRLAEHMDVRAVDLGEAALFADVLCEGLGTDRARAAFSALIGQSGLTGYLAWQGGVAMGAGALLVDDGWGWLWLAATRPAFRKRGVQSALLARRIVDGKALGVHTFNVAVTYASESQDDVFASYRNVQRAGFDLAYRRPNYVVSR